MKIAVFGTGYVGLVSGVGFANLGHHVICMDNNEEKVVQLKQGNPVIHEMGLTELLKKNITNQRIYFTTSVHEAVEAADILFLALPTPSLPDGKADTSILHSMVATIGQHMTSHKIIVNKSTAPVGTLKALQKIIRKETKHSFDIVSNPEFLKEGTALNDFLHPDRIIIGSESAHATEQMKTLYRPLLMNGHPLLAMDIASAELTKYAANCMLAARIALINQMANLCDTLGANIDWIRKGLAKDSRIGSKFLYAGVGYGGSCFPKDVRSLIHTSLEHNTSLSIMEAVNECNEKQWQVFYNKIATHFNNELVGKIFAVWGLSFKPHTDDVREAPALLIIKKMIDAGANIQAHDPIAIKNAKLLLPAQVTFESNMYAATKKVHALLLITEWPDYFNPDYDKLKSTMQETVLFDGRNALDMNEVKDKGFTYYGMGKNIENA